MYRTPGIHTGVTYRAFELSMYYSSRRKFHHCDLLICPPELSEYGAFDTRNLRPILDAGYAAGKKRIDELRQILDRHA